MTLKEFILGNEEQDIDVYNDVWDDEGVAICLPIHFTDEGLREFADVLELEVEASHYTGEYSYLPLLIVKLSKLPDAEQDKMRERLNVFLWSQAGYCSVELFDKWFKEVE